MSTNDAPENDRDNARTALDEALKVAREGKTQEADAFTRIADAHIRMAGLERRT